MKLQLKKTTLLNLSDDQQALPQQQVLPLQQTHRVAGGQAADPQSSYVPSDRPGCYGGHLSDRNTFCMISGGCETYFL